jgi:hypothetical protein
MVDTEGGLPEICTVFRARFRKAVPAGDSAEVATEWRVILAADPHRAVHLKVVLRACAPANVVSFVISIKSG